MPTQPHPRYCLAPERYAVVDNELRRCALYFDKLAAELKAAGGTPHWRSHSLTQIEMLQRHLAELRHALATEQEWSG